MPYTKRLMVPGFLFLFGAIAALGQKVSVESQQSVEQTLATMTTMKVLAVEACTNGSATLGIAVNGSLGPGDCTSFDPTYGTFYADFYAFNATAGHTLKVEATSTMMYLATVQNYSTGSVLASTGSCGHTQDSCSFNYTAPSSGTYLLGIGAFGTGNYLLRVSDLSIAPPAGCTANSTNLCLVASRFRVSVAWQSTTSSGSGHAISMTSDTGYFWFFDSSNIEAVVKVLDARTVNNHFWVFAAGLTNVQATITVTDTQTGTIRTYQNPQGVAFQPVQDTLAFTP